MTAADHAARPPWLAGRMHVFLTGASGYIGSSVLRSLVAHGDEVTALVRSDEKAQHVRDAGGRALVGDVTDTEVVERLLHESDGVVHTASAPDVDPDFIRTAIAALAGTPKPFVHTGGIFTFGDSTDISEQSPIDLPALTAWRGPNEALLRASDVRSTIVAPGIVYGRGAGIPAMFVGDGEQPVRLVGDGSQRWTTVHVDDLGELYVLALHHGELDGYIVAATGDNPTVRESSPRPGPTVHRSSPRASTRAANGSGRTSPTRCCCTRRRPARTPGRPTAGGRHGRRWSTTSPPARTSADRAETHCPKTPASRGHAADSARRRRIRRRGTHVAASDGDAGVSPAREPGKRRTGGPWRRRHGPPVRRS
ncbi:NAD(P)H-binding protein [Curtobacterium flaccumfaciens]|nr:NAD(P)H-binding protein [Curtobacterium flaccumfaciens]